MQKLDLNVFIEMTGNHTEFLKALESEILVDGVLYRTIEKDCSTVYPMAFEIYVDNAKDIMQMLCNWLTKCLQNQNAYTVLDIISSIKVTDSINHSNNDRYIFVRMVDDNDKEYVNVAKIMEYETVFLILYIDII